MSVVRPFGIPACWIEARLRSVRRRIPCTVYPWFPATATINIIPPALLTTMTWRIRSETVAAPRLHVGTPLVEAVGAYSQINRRTAEAWVAVWRTCRPLSVNWTIGTAKGMTKRRTEGCSYRSDVNRNEESLGCLLCFLIDERGFSNEDSADNNLLYSPNSL